ncbi:MAG TPA: hypothetical protein VGG13_00975 [Candidatus Saccharimonadales bacterium]|jgi:hypothetical protein
MFGHQDDLNSQHDNKSEVSEPQADATLTQDTGTATLPSIPAPTASSANDAPASAPPVGDDTAGDYIVTEPRLPVGASAASSSAPAATQPVSPDDLLDLKQSALHQLTPLLGHLDQTPEEKFRTTMMMIQAADNQSLLKEAYAAAQAIPDEKARAQALLDVVNEINYFTQQQPDAA